MPEEGEYLFPGGKEGAGLSNAAMSELLKGMGYSPDYATVHGFRSTFKDWCSDMTSFPNEMSEWRFRIRFPTRLRPPIAAATWSNGAGR